MRRRRPALGLAAGLAALLVCAVPRAEQGAASFYALSPPTAGGVEAVDRALARLATHRRLLVVGAHPDDEDTEILAFVAKGLGGEAAYLSLTRGEGGQNLVGPDLGVGLGLVRSQELSAARRLDGARQYFTRAYDFGFTRSLDEALAKWPREALFGDAVRVVRRFRPQVVVSIFNGTARDGHGQHQAAGVTAREAFRLAGDPAAFPELAAEGLTPWKPVTLLQETGYWDDKEATTVVLPTGRRRSADRAFRLPDRDGEPQPPPLAGHGHSSRSPGPNQTSVGWVDGGAGRGGTDLFSGVDTRLRAMAAEVPDAARRAEIEKLLDAVEARRRRGAPPALDAGAGRGRPGRREGGREPPRRPRARARRRRRDRDAPRREDRAGAARARRGGGRDARRALGPRDGGARARRSRSRPPSGTPAARPSPSRASRSSPRTAGRRRRRPPGRGASRQASSRNGRRAATVPAGARATVPYFLERPLRGDLYDWSAAPAAVRGEPFQPAPRPGRRASHDRGRARRSRARGRLFGSATRPSARSAARCAPPRRSTSRSSRTCSCGPSTQKAKHLEVTLLSNAAGAGRGPARDRAAGRAGPRPRRGGSRSPGRRAPVLRRRPPGAARARGRPLRASRFAARPRRRNHGESRHPPDRLRIHPAHADAGAVATSRISAADIRFPKL